MLRFYVLNISELIIDYIFINFIYPQSNCFDDCIHLRFIYCKRDSSFIYVFMDFDILI